MAVKGQDHDSDPSGTTAFMVDAEGRTQPVSATNPMPVAFVDSETVNLTGDVVVDTLGALDNSKVTDPDAASATIPALLRGILEELQAQTVLLTTIASNTAS
jgi:hypothetical protein